MRTITTNWSIMRWLRLVIGVIALVQSIIQKDNPAMSTIYFAIMGALVLNLFKKSEKQIQNDGIS